MMMMIKTVCRMLSAMSVLGLLIPPAARAQGRLALAPLAGIGGITWQSETDTVAGRPILLQIEGNRLAIYSLENPVAPVQIGSLVSPYALVKFYLHRDLAYVISSQFNEETDWLTMVDYSDPSAPKVIARKAFQSLQLAFGFHGNHLYLSAGSDGLKVFDITDPTAIKEVTGWTNLVYPTDIASQDNRLYITENRNGFFIFDVTNPTPPRKIGEYNAAQSSQHRIAVMDTLALISFSRGIQIVSVKDPLRPRHIKDVYVDKTPSHIVVRGGLAYVVCQYNLISIIDISVPDSAKVIGTQRDGGEAVHIALGENHLYTATFAEGMQIVSIADPASPALVRTIASPHWASDFRQSGKTLYLGGLRQGMQIFDLDNPALPRRLASLDSGVEALWIETFRDEVAVAGSNNSSKLKVIDIKDKTAPKVIDSIALGADWLVHGLSKTGDHLYVSTIQGLQVYRVAAGQSVTKMYADTLRAHTHAVEVRGNLALMARGLQGLQLADVSVPEKPAYLGRIDKLGSALDGVSRFAWHGDMVYTQDSGKGMAMVDVSDPSKPVKVGSLPEQEYAMYLAVWKNHLLVLGSLDGIPGLCILDISDPVRPVREGIIPIRDLAGEFQSMRIVGDRLYLSHSSNGLRIYDLSEVPVTAQLVRPRAGNRREAVPTGRFLRQAGGIRHVFDALGRFLAF